MLRAIVGLAAYRFINSGISRKWTEGRKTELLLAITKYIYKIMKCRMCFRIQDFKNHTRSVG